MEDWEKRSLTAFRAVAREVRQSSIVTNGLTIKQWLVQGTDDVKIEISLLPAEAFLALCVMVRKVYMQEGPAHFYKVNNIVGRYDRGEHQKRAAAVRADYELILRGNGAEFRVHGTRVLHEELFESWLNGYAFHQDAFKDPTSDARPYELLKAALGPVVDAVVQKVALQLAGCVLEMDDVIADCLGEERLARIEPVTQV